MKKALLYALTLALALSLTACGQPKAGQPTNPAPSTSTPEPIATPEPIKDTQPPEETDPQEDGQALEELSGAELQNYFQLAYDSCTAFDSSSQEEQITFELEILQSFCDTDGEKLPTDYADQYRAWRPVETEKIPEDNTETKTHDTPEKTTLPAAKPSTSENNQQKPADEGQQKPVDNQQQDQGSTNGSYDPDADAWNPYEGMTPEEKEAQIKADQEATQKIVDGNKVYPLSRTK